MCCHDSKNSKIIDINNHRCDDDEGSADAAISSLNSQKNPQELAACLCLKTL